MDNGNIAVENGPTRLHHKAVGSGRPAILFIHGYGGDARHWRHQIEALSRVTSCVSFDLRGHGRSRSFLTGCNIEVAANDALAVSQEVAGKSPMVVVGHSMGARIALQVAMTAPNRVSELVLVDGSCAPDDPKAIARGAEQEISRLGYEQFARKTLNGYLVDQLPAKDQRSLLASNLLLDPKVAITYLASMAQWDGQGFDAATAGVQAKVTVLRSTSLAEDTSLPRFRIAELATSRWLDAWSRQAQAYIKRVPNAGHYTMLEDPAVVTNAIQNAFLSASPVKDWEIRSKA